MTTCHSLAGVTKGPQPPASVYQPQSGYPEIDQPPTHHTADSIQRDSAEHEQSPLDNSEVLQSRSSLPAPAEGKSHSAEATSHLPASHSSRSDSQLCDDHIVLDSSGAAANQQVPEAAPVHFLHLRRPQCSCITAQLVPERLAVGPPSHGGSCHQHSDETAKTDQMDVDATPGNDNIPGHHKTAGKVGPVEYHNMKNLQLSSSSMLMNSILNQNTMHVHVHLLLLALIPCICTMSLTAASFSTDRHHCVHVIFRWCMHLGGACT